MSSMASTMMRIASLIIANTNVHTVKILSASIPVNLIEFKTCFEKLSSRKKKIRKIDNQCTERDSKHVSSTRQVLHGKDEVFEQRSQQEQQEQFSNL